VAEVLVVLKVAEHLTLLMVVLLDQEELFLEDHMQVEENLVLVVFHYIGNQIQQPCIMVNLDLPTLVAAADVDGG
jgi:hypothetical protein